MSEGRIIIWKLRDGRLVDFNHPDAYEERLGAIRKWKNSPGFEQRMNEDYEEEFVKKAREIDT